MLLLDRLKNVLQGSEVGDFVLVVSLVAVTLHGYVLPALFEIPAPATITILRPPRNERFSSRSKPMSGDFKSRIRGFKFCERRGFVIGIAFCDLQWSWCITEENQMLQRRRYYSKFLP